MKHTTSKRWMKFYQTGSQCFVDSYSLLEIPVRRWDANMMGESPPSMLMKSQNEAVPVLLHTVVNYILQYAHVVHSDGNPSQQEHRGYYHDPLLNPSVDERKH